MSDTPRTDEREARSEGLHDERAFTLCRQLERELTEARDRQWANSVHSCHDECARPICTLRRERDEARKDVLDLMEEYEDRQKQYGGEYMWERDEDAVLIKAICKRLIKWETNQPKP